ncbi:Serine dehydratase-like, alpha subunit [Phaffia rhodozyma]|uniref:Serine dehydratase-like, alpha subunit n=1 Tax=Phaffia rhodozyma TaxID=264483 RepID=A0A0F7SJZ0_PHARH|nr:Serine dehydratase-like, alpha subunit [Phaffia rhodozyma]
MACRLLSRTVRSSFPSAVSRQLTRAPLRSLGSLINKSASLQTDLATSVEPSFSRSTPPPLQPPKPPQDSYSEGMTVDDAIRDIAPGVGHAVISTFDLFSIGVGPSSSHTVGPMRAGKIFVFDLEELGLIDKVKTIKVSLYGSLAATGKGHMTPQAVMMGLEGSDPETIETSTLAGRYDAILNNKKLILGGKRIIDYDMDKDMIWNMTPLPTHPNGMRFSVFDNEGDLLATNEYFSVGGGFVINERTKVDENMYYRSINKSAASPARRDQTHGMTTDKIEGIAAPDELKSEESQRAHEHTTTGQESGGPNEDKKKQQPKYLFHNAASLEALTRKHNLTIAQLVWNNELSYMTSQQITDNLLKIWGVMDSCIRDGVSSREDILPGGLNVKRRSPLLYRRLFKGFYPSINTASTLPKISAPAGSSTSSTATSLTMASGFNSPPPLPLKSGLGPSGTGLVHGDFTHDLPVTPWKNTVFPGVDFLSCYAIAVNEVNAAGGRVVTAPTNGAAGVIPAVLKYIIEFVSDDAERDVKTFLLTSAAIGMLFKRSATISAAEGGCMAEVGVASAMAAGGFVACMGGSPKMILQAAEIGIEHSLGLTCDPVAGLVQIPCIERNSLGAVKAVCAAQLALAGDGTHSVSLDDAIHAMRLTSIDMHSNYKETSLSGLATTVKIPLSSPAC